MVAVDEAVRACRPRDLPQRAQVLNEARRKEEEAQERDLDVGARHALLAGRGALRDDPHL